MEINSSFGDPPFYRGFVSFLYSHFSFIPQFAPQMPEDWEELSGASAPSRNCFLLRFDFFFLTLFPRRLPPPSLRKK